MKTYTAQVSRLRPYRFKNRPSYIGNAIDAIVVYANSAQEARSLINSRVQFKIDKGIFKKGKYGFYPKDGFRKSWNKEFKKR